MQAVGVAGVQGVGAAAGVHEAGVAGVQGGGVAGVQGGLGWQTDLQQGVRGCLLDASTASLPALLLLYLYLSSVNTELKTL